MSTLSAQKKDTIPQKQRTLSAVNPNARRNGYENYQNAADASGVGLNPGATINSIDHRYEGLRGTPYFLSSWSKGQLDMLNGQTYPNALIKFDVFRQQVILLRTWAGGDSISINTDQLKSFQLRSETGETFRFKRLPDPKIPDEKLKENFFLVLADGKTALLKRITKKFKPADYKDPYGSNIRYDSFVDSHAYYLLKANSSLVKIKLSKKSFLDALGDQKTTLKAFLDEQQFNFGTDADAEANSIKIIQYYNSL